MEALDLKAQFPLKLRPENEQLLALQLWEPLLADTLQVEGWSESQTVRRALDLLQLAATADVPMEDIVLRLRQGLVRVPASTWEALGAALGDWRTWCLTGRNPRACQ